ncbi:MAG: TAT-variant-translocated molybdopterin oxidoreductase [Candidatus Cloacimonetes bacterium]|nr:TAT-variant-translocated molybdopterin oxidoreductase [Candidatus Cloacimonadota bacterium]
MKEIKEPTYWTSFEELHKDPSHLDGRTNEFADGADEVIKLEDMSGVSRRRFLALLGASAALAGTGCTNYRGHGKIVSWSKQPEGVVLGRPNFYASTCSGCEDACGVLVKTREGRPIKVDGNPEHPMNQGKICEKGQGSVLALYNPERIRKPMKSLGKDKGFQSLEWTQIDSEVQARLKALGTSRVAIVTNTVNSPSTARLLESYRSQFKADVFAYEQFSDSTRQKAWKLSHAQGSFPSIAWHKADLILGFESDFMSAGSERMKTVREIASRRSLDNGNHFTRIVLVEGDVSMTGANADIRHAISPVYHLDIVLGLLHEISVVRKLSDYGSNPSFLKLVSGMDLKSVSEKTGLDLASLTGLADDLVANRGKAIVHAGDLHSLNVHLAVNLLNAALGNQKLYETKQSKVQFFPVHSTQELKALSDALLAGIYSVVIHLDCNPVYDLPADLKYAEALGKVSTVITFAQLPSETTHLSHYVLPDNHDFESWGDYQNKEGIISLQQPVISAIYDTRQAEGCLLSWSTAKPYTQDLWHDFVRNRWEKEFYPGLKLSADFVSFWNSCLHDGVFQFAYKPSQLSPIIVEQTVSSVQKSQSTGFTLILRPSYSVGDGRFASNGWLQEMSHPISRVTWDNYVAVAPAVARKLKISSEDNVSIKVGEEKMILPALVQPGLNENTLVVEIGYGRQNSGVVATGVGFNANRFLKSSGGLSAHIYDGVELNKAVGSYTLASIQEHHQIDLKGPGILLEKLTDPHLRREIIRENSLTAHQADPQWLAKRQEFKKKHVFSIYEEEQKYPDVKWAMSIDQNKCNGCGICVVACSSENNIPVVGKDQIKRGRTMHWLRIDRYYSGKAETPKISFQPMLCQHCDNAPCENVCPVGATTHSPEGLNDMAYNRCVGTRYCANNCPYKVRRFNFYDFRSNFAKGHYYNEPMDLAMNPEVSVRSRGVMEKCSFCVQRIMDSRQEAKKAKVQFNGLGVTTACQDACPTEAIQFGNVNQPETNVAKAREHELNYHVLEELNVKPNVTYLARLRNSREEVKS